MEPFLGQIQPFGFNFPPRGWAFCDGQILPINSYQSLYSLLGTTYGGDGRTSFALPDLRGRTIRHVGTGSGLGPVSWGQKGGAETIALTTATMPSHNHTFKATSNPAGVDEPSNSVVIGSGDVIYSIETSGAVNLRNSVLTNTGNGQAFNSMNPFIGIWVCIALTGLFPSRN